jgi:hypothetical protein
LTQEIRFDRLAVSILSGGSGTRPYAAYENLALDKRANSRRMRTMAVRSHPSLLLLAALSITSANAQAESSDTPRVFETRPLKLIGDGAASSTPAAPPAQGQIAITTPPLRLVGDGASAPERTPPQALTIETRPLKLIGARP